MVARRGPAPPDPSAAPPDPSLPAGGPRAAIFDPFSGISGDMLLGAWSDLGLGREWLLEVAAAIGVPLARLEVERVERAGLAAVRVGFEPAEAGGAGGREAPDGGGHGVPGGHGRSWVSIRRQIEESALGERSRALALGAFARLAAAEGRAHGIPPERVHFHELGAADALLDVCAGVDGFVRLGISEASTLPVGIGSGRVDIHHGRYPLPAPATAYLLEGTAIRPTGYEGELVTPTGAALLAELAGGRPAVGDAVVERVGYGAGARNPPGWPNCLRVWLTRPAGAARPVHVLQADVDDMSPEYVPGLLEACLAAGALDAVVHPLGMKKGRPGWRVECVVEPGARAQVEEAVLRHSTTLGVRSWPVTRRTLFRSVEERRWRGHRIRVKSAAPAPGSLDLQRAKAEYEDVAAAAAAEGLDPARVLAELRRTWPDLG